MELLYSNILPVGLEENQKTIQDCFADQIANCDGVEIAVGYVSKASLEQLDALVEQYHIPHINLVIGSGQTLLCILNAPIHTGKGYEEIQVRKRNSRIRLECLCPGR